MKFLPALLAGAMSVLCVIAASPSAQANVVNLGTVASGSSNVAVNNDFTVVPFGSLYGATGAVDGLLPAFSEITFTYTFPSSLAGTSDISSTFTTPSFGNITASATPGSNGFASAPLGFVSANLNLPYSAQTVVSNSGPGAVSFASLLNVIMTAAGPLTLTYSVSSIPLPGTLLMFLAVVAGLFGYARLHKNRQTLTLS